MNEDAYKLQKNLQSQPAAHESGRLALRSQARSSDYHFSMRLLATDRLFQKVKTLRAAQLSQALSMVRVRAEVRQQ